MDVPFSPVSEATSQGRLRGSVFGLDSAWVADQVEALVAAWNRGERPTAEEFLARYPELDDEASVRLIYEEVCLRRDMGQDVVTAEVVSRFPRWKTELEAILVCDRLMRPPIVVAFPEVGDRLGDFQLVAELGRGAAGRTFLAAQPSLADRPVVLKVTDNGHDEHLSLARLQHTHIVPLYSKQAFPDRGLQALCMPFLGGVNLAQVLSALARIPVADRVGRDILNVLDAAAIKQSAGNREDGPYRHYLDQSSYVDAICWIAACLADALKYAHDRGLIHMDVKPANVLIAADGQAMLLDFHLARAPIVVGGIPPDRLGCTPGWTSPEQRAAIRAVVDGRPITEPVDGRTDLYALGLLLYEALGGPHVEDHTTNRPRLERCNSRVSLGLADLVHKGLSTDPRSRYADAASLADDLRRHLANLPLLGVPNRSLRERWRKWRRRRPQSLARGSAALSLIVATFVVLALIGELYRQRTIQLRATLEDSRRFQASGQFLDAGLSAKRGLDLARNVPYVSAMTKRLEAQYRQSQRAGKASALHEVADRLRLRYGRVSSGTEEEATIVESCRRIWAGRDLLANPRDAELDAETEHRIKTDFLEIALVWTSLRDRLDPAASREASRLLDDAAATFGTSPALRLERRTLATSLGMPNAQIAADPPSSSDWEHDALGRSHLRAGRIAEAAEEFRLAVERQPQDFWPNFYQGLCAYRLKNNSEALAAFRVCISLSPETAECYVNRGLVYEALGETKSAEMDYTRALERNGGLTEAALNRGILRLKSSRPNEAIADLHLALQSRPGRELSGRIYLNLALAQIAIADRNSANKSLESAVRSGNDEAKVLLRNLRDKP